MRLGKFSLLLYTIMPLLWFFILVIQKLFQQLCVCTYFPVILVCWTRRIPQRSNKLSVYPYLYLY